MQMKMELLMPDNEKNEIAEIPKLIERFMQQESLTPGKLAQILNVAETTVQRWLKGEARPTGTAAAVLWTLIGIGGIAIGAAAVASGLGIYRLLNKKLGGKEQELENMIQAERAAKEKKKRLEEIKALREILAEKEAELEELEELTKKEG
jgi:DNA-binding transcriptional regulator YiaG